MRRRPEAAACESMIAHIVFSMRGIVRRACLVAVLVLSACAPATLAGTDLGATDAPDFTLTDGMTGRAVTLSTQRGQVVALTFLYSNCRDVCPYTAIRFRAAHEVVQAVAGRVIVLSV